MRKVVTTMAAAISLLAGFAAWSQDAPGFEEETARLEEALLLEPGLTVADVGAGEGEYSAFLAGAVGPTGAVYATEVQEKLLDEIGKAVAGYENVSVILGEQDSTGLPAECCDRILLRRVFHHFEDPEAMLASLLSALKPGGLIAVVDFLRESHEMPRADATPEDHEHGVRIDDLTEKMQAAGFELVGRVEDWPSRVHHGRETDFCLVFRRPE